MGIKNTYHQILYATLFCTVLVSCVSRQTPLTESQIDTSTPTLSDTDQYVRESFVGPYNINVRYTFDDFEINTGRTLYPPSIDRVKPVLEIIRQVWIESYNSVNANIIKEIAPRLLVLVGGYNHNPSGTITLGLAEGGIKITLFNVNQLDVTDRDRVSRFLKTIQHEYTHLLNQTKPYTPEFRKITSEDYTSNWYDSSNAEANELGFITAYARAQDGEDFAEMVSMMLTYDKAGFDAIVDGIESEDAKSNIRRKEDIVVEYFKTEYNIDLYELQQIVSDATDRVVDEAKE